MTDKIVRPNHVTTEMLEYLDVLRESGVTNMWGATPYIMEEFPDLNKRQAGEVLVYWIKTYGDFHDSTTRAAHYGPDSADPLTGYTVL